MKGRFGGFVLIVAGAVALAHNLGYLSVNLAQLLHTWWPAIVIAVGVGLLFTPNRRR